MLQFAIFVFCLFLTYTFYLLLSRKTEARKARLEKRISEALLYSSQTHDPEVNLAREELMSEIPWVDSFLIKLQSASQLKRFIDQSDLDMTVMRLLLFSGLAGFLAAMAVSIISNSTLFLVFAGLISAALPFVHVWWKRRRRLDRFLELLPDALDLMSRALLAGHAFAEALHMLSKEMSEPIASEFGRAYEEQNLGLSVKLALENLCKRIPLLDLRMAVTAIMIQRETGGNLGEILEKVAGTIRERFRILADLKTLTTSSRMSAWILCGLPILVAVMVTFLNPDYMSVLWKDSRGHNLIAIAMTMQIIGMLLVRKILNIRV
ncbi:MAG TPA: type II secretion system F family protein [Pyrinomonadaceae bacterium]|nr:type II secretion system F family protein [Pyrinomonadaceae bacterium]